jgi:hypothetical protein
LSLASIAQVSAAAAIRREAKAAAGRTAVEGDRRWKATAEIDAVKMLALFRLATLVARSGAHAASGPRRVTSASRVNKSGYP